MNKKLYLLLLGMMMLALAACGGGEEASNDADAGPELVRMTVKGFDTFDFDPETISVPAGSNVTITLDNEGALEHNWLLVPADADPLTASDTDVINQATTGSVAGGQTGRVTFSAPEPGTYQFICNIAGHAAGGMVGTFVVEAAQ